MRTHLLAALLLVATSSAATVLFLDEGKVCNDLPSGKWYCMKEADCKGSSEALKNGWKPAVCSYRDEEMILCCPPTPPRTSSQAAANSSGGVQQLAWSGSWDKLPSGGWNLHKQTTARPAEGSTLAQTGKPPQDVLPNPRPTPAKPAPLVTKPSGTTTAAANMPQPEGHFQPALPMDSAVAKAQEMCRSYSGYVWMVEPIISFPGAEPEKKEYCGRSTKPLVFGGEDAEAYEFPHMARIGYGDEEDIQYQCGGSLISERFILSAAHCSVVDEREARWANLGDCALNTDRDVPKEEVVTVKIVERIVHPDYDSDKNWYNDIALFRLEKDLKLGIYVRPACLNTRRDREEKSLIASGWGLTKPLSPFAFDIGSKGEATILQKVELKVIPNDQCNSTYRTLSDKDRAQFMEGIRPKGMICAGGVPGKAICNGDSGGPLQAPAPDCMYDIVGVTSFGLGCKSTFPGVYTSVVDYLPWIVGIVWG